MSCKSKRKLNVLPENPDSAKNDSAVGPGRFPKWLHRKLPQGNDLWKTQEILSQHRLPTVCEEAKCPNLLECWSKKTATFLVMGKECTRSCGFCDIDFAANPKKLEADEPDRLAESVVQLRLKHVVITMVARDDLQDGGAEHLGKIISAVRNKSPGVTIEVLTSDFEGNPAALETVLAAQPDIFNHNIETTRSLTPKVRHKATYDRSLFVLKSVKKLNPSIYLKSGLMLGLGEETDEVKQAISDLYEAGCQVITIGQYLQASRFKLRVKSFIHPDQFTAYADYGTSIGVEHMHCGPFVRSSYNAASVFQNIQQKKHG